MRKLILFSAVLSLFLPVPASITWAQTISSQKGLTTIVFNVTQGVVKVYLPDDIRPGDIISGTVRAEPAGKNAGQTGRNLAELRQYSLKIEGIRHNVTSDPEPFKWIVPADRTFLSPVELMAPNGSSVGKATLPFNKSTAENLSGKGCSAPSHVLTSTPLKITGSFDGDLANTNCLLDNQPVQILAESPRQCQIVYPENGQGSHSLKLSESGEEKCSQTVSGVEMKVTTGKLNLRKGQNTFIEVNLTGISNLPSSAVLSMKNLSPEIVKILPANDVIVPIYPDDVHNGQFLYRLDITSIRAGSFDVDIYLDLPDPPFQFNPEKATGGDQKADSIPCPPEANLTKEQDVLDALKAELAGIGAAIAAAKKDTADCKKENRAKKAAARAANDNFNIQAQRKKNWTQRGTTIPDNVNKAYDKALEEKEKADKEVADQKAKCEAADKKLKDLENRQSILPALITTQEALVNILKTEAEKCRKEAEEKKKKEEEDKKKAAEAAAYETAAAAAEAEARRSAVAHQRYLLQNIYSLGLISSKEFWEIKGLWDWLPEKLSKPIGDFAEDKGNPSPIPIDIIPALAGIYQLAGQLLDPCTAEGSLKTIQRLKKMTNTKTNSLYTDEEALTKAENMCEALNKLKAMSKAAGGK